MPDGSAAYRFRTISTMSSPASVGFWPDLHAGLPQGFHLGRGGALAARDDGAGVAHLLAGRRGHAGDVGRRPAWSSSSRDELGRLLLGRAADLADHHHGLGVGVGLEGLQAVDERRAGTGSPPMPTHVVTPMSCSFSS